MASASAGNPKAISSLSDAPTSPAAETLSKLASLARAADLEKHMYRRWHTGDVYAPHDLTSVEMIKWRKRQKPDRDAFDVLGLNPLKEYKVSRADTRFR